MMTGGDCDDCDDGDDCGDDCGDVAMRCCVWRGDVVMTVW
jgi:hypothetical protein